MRKFGLIGYPLSHSFSPGFFRRKFEREGFLDAEYKAYPMEQIADIQLLIDAGLTGFNVTIPYKEQIIEYLSDMSTAASQIGAVNTVQILEQGLIGHNTDVIGFRQSLFNVMGDRELSDQALILGTGGAAKAVQYVLDDLGITSKLVSRSAGDLTYHQLNSTMIHEHQLIVNTTPLGMYPHMDSAPSMPYHAISREHTIFDLIYNPEKTLFLKKAERQGATISNGLEMLHLQAEASWAIWNNIAV